MRGHTRQPAMRARLLLLPCSALAALACAHTPQGPLPGASDSWRENTARPPAAKSEAPTWSRYAELRSGPPLNAQPFPTQGHRPALEVDIVVSAEARASYTNLVTDSALPDGALVAELAHDASNPNAHAWIMTKRAGEWSYLELDAGGRVLEEGRLVRCEGCHALAPADHLFGLPRAAP